MLSLRGADLSLRASPAAARLSNPPPRGPGFQAVVERAAGDAQQACRGALVAVGGAQGGQDARRLVAGRLRAGGACLLVARERSGIGIGSLSVPFHDVTHHVREMMDIQRVPVHQDDGPLHRVAQLPHVAGPRVAHQRGECFRREDGNRLVVARCAFEQEGLHQFGNVFRSLPQRRNLQRDDVEPVVQVGPKPAGGHLLIKAAVGGGDDARFEGQGLGPADAVKLALLEHAQELGLQLERKFPNLIEEERPAAGQLQLARFAAPFGAVNAPAW